ncbi:hypothetical protein ABPG74_011699 [Tetrahymena malaccensis]
MSIKVVKGFSLQLNLNLKKSEEEESICLSIEENLPQLVVEQKTCQLIGQQSQGKAYLDLSKVCKCQFSQEYLYLIENLSKKNKFEKTMPVQFNNLENDQEKIKFLTQDQLVNNVILTKNSYEHNEESITIYDFSNISEIMQLFLNNFWIEFALMKENNQLISKLIFNNVTFVINKIDQSSNNLQIISNPVMQLLASKTKAKISQISQKSTNNKNEKDQINNTIRTGYLSMDSKQRIIPLLAQDEGVYKVPLIGIWIQSDENVNDIFLWTLFIEYAKNGAMKKCNLSNNSSSAQNNQKTSSTLFSTVPNYSDISFLFVWFQSCDVTNPLFFQIQITQSSINKCFQKAQLSSTSSVIKFDYRYSKFKPVNIIENGLNHTFEAQDQINKPNKQQSNIANLMKGEENKLIENPKCQNGKEQNIFKQFSQKQGIELLESQNKFQQSFKENDRISSNKQKQVKDEDFKLKSSLTNTSEDFFPIKDYNLQSQNAGQKDKSLSESYKNDNLKLSTRDLNISLNQSKQVQSKGVDAKQLDFKEQITSTRLRSQSQYNSNQSQQTQSNLVANPEKYLNSQMQLLDSQKQIMESKKILEERKINKKEVTNQVEKEKQLFYKSSNQNQSSSSANQKDLTQFQHNTLKQHQTLFEQNSKIEELEKQIQQLKKELQLSKSKDKYSPRVLENGNSGNSEYSTVKKRSSKSVYSTNSTCGVGSGGSLGSGNTNSSKGGSKFVSRINKSTIESPTVNPIIKSSIEKVSDNCQASSFAKNQRNQYSANSQATTATGNKSIDSRLLSQNQNNSFNMTNKSLNTYKYLSGFSNNKDIDLTIGQLQSNEKPPIGCLSTARSNQLRSSIKNINQALNTQRTSSSKQLQKQQASSSSGSGANIKRSRFLECNDELPRIKFDFSNINDNEESDEDSSNEIKNKSDKLLKYKLHSNTNQSKTQSIKLNNFINF